MVSLFKDPEGEKIFTAHVEALQGTTTLGRLINDDLLSMKRKLKQMEDVTEEYKVNNSSQKLVVTGIHEYLNLPFWILVHA